jgi:hypothetical protein
MAGKNWMEKLSKLKGAVVERRDVHATVVQTRSPSLNFIYGNSWGLPKGYSTILYGPPKSGKSVIGYEHVGQLHRDYTDDIAIKFNTEFREEGQLSPKMMEAYGIDPKRYMGFDSNHPAEIYDVLENEVDVWCKEGMPLGLVIIDSMNGVQGRRALGDEGGIMQQQIGDVALTNKEGLKRVLQIQRRHRFSLLMSCHVAIEMDAAEQRRGNKFKMGAGIGVQHHAEYFVYVEPVKGKEGVKSQVGGEKAVELIDSAKTDMLDKGQAYGHRVRVVMKDSSMGPKGRTGEFTFSDHEGIINTHEEVYHLGMNRGVVLKDGGNFYTVTGYPTPKIKGEQNFADYLKTDKTCQDFILKELRRQDQMGLSIQADAKAAAENAAPDWERMVEQEVGAPTLPPLSLPA